MPKNKYKNNVGNKNIKGGTLIPFHKEGNTTYFRVLANDPFKTDSVLVGPNNKNGIALDDNEIVKETKNHIEVASDDLGTTKVIESLSSKMPLPDAFRQGYIKQELYKKENNITNSNKMKPGGKTNISTPIIISNSYKINNNKQYKMPFDTIIANKKQSNQSTFFTGGRTQMANGGNKEIKADIEPAIITAEKPNTRDKFYIRKKKIGNKIYYDVDGKLIDNETNAYKYATSIMKARGTIDMSDTLNASNISSDRKRMPFDNIDFTIPNNNKLKDGRKWVIDSLKLSPKEKEAFIYETSSYKDRPKKNNKSKEDKDVYTVSRYEDNPFIKESTFVGPVLRKRGINITNNNTVEKQIESTTKPIIKSTKNEQSRLKSINKNSLTSDYTPIDIVPSKEIEDITLDNTVAKRVGQEILNGNEYLSSIDVLNPIKRQVQSPVKKEVYNIGKSGPSFGDKLRLGWDKFKKFMSTPEGAFAASAATDVAGNIIASGIERRAIDSTKYAPAPIQNSTSKMLTNYNINPQLASIRNEVANAQRDVTENTLSSKARQNRLNLLGLNTALNNNQLYANKENIETQLINQDAMNQQNIRNSNIDAYNKWLAAKTEFDNNKILNKANSTVSVINGIGQALGNYASNLLQSQQFANNVNLYKALNPDAAKVVPTAKCGGRYNKKRRK